MADEEQVPRAAEQEASILRKKIDEVAKHFERRADHAKRNSKITIWGQLVGAAATTFATGVVLWEFQSAWSLVALATSAATTVMAGANSQFAYRARWVHHTGVAGQLKGLATDIAIHQARLNGLSDDEAARVTDDIRARLRQLLDESHDDWSKIEGRPSGPTAS